MDAIKAFLRGFSAYFKVIPLFSSLGLWRYLLLTAGISFGVLVFIGLLAYATANAVLAIDWTSFLGGHKALEVAAAVFAFVGVLAIGVLLFKHLVLIATAPWMGKVAKQVGSHLIASQGLEEKASLRSVQEASSGGRAFAKTEEERWRLIKRSIRLNGRLFTLEMLLTIPLLLLGLIPGINIGAAIALVMVQSYFVGAGTLDFTLEERYSYGESVAYFNNNRWLTIGIGLGFVLLLFTAIGFLFAPAWSAAASAYAYHNRIGRQRL